MFTYSWKSIKSKSYHYKRRSPETSSLYRIAYQERQNLEYQWEQQFQQKFGSLRFEVLDAIDKYLNCGILLHGCARILCDTCKHSTVVAFSCKRRGICPSCDTKRALIFAEHLHSEILKPVAHRHVVFSLPKRIRVFFKYNRKLGSILFRSAWETLLELYQIVGAGIPGAALTFQTAGESLNFNPHIHGIVSSGTFNSDKFCELPAIDNQSLQELFTHKVLKALLHKELITQDNIDYLMSQKHTGFSAWMGERVDPAETLQNIGNLSVEGSKVSFDDASLDQIRLDFFKNAQETAKKICEDIDRIGNDLHSEAFCERISKFTQDLPETEILSLHTDTLLTSIKDLENCLKQHKKAMDDLFLERTQLSLSSGDSNSTFSSTISNQPPLHVR